MFVLKKFKTVELNNWNKNIITTSVIKIVNKIIDNETDKKKNSAMNVFIVIKRIITKTNAVND